MEEARWADVAIRGLGGGPGRKWSTSGLRVQPPAEGCSGGSWVGTVQGEGQQNDHQLGSKEGIPHPTGRILESQHSRASELEGARCIVLLGLLGSRASFPESLSVPGAVLSTLPSNLHHNPARPIADR